MKSPAALDVLLSHNYLDPASELPGPGSLTGLLGGTVYGESLQRRDGELFAIAREEGTKVLLIAGQGSNPGRDFTGPVFDGGAFRCKLAPFGEANAAALRAVFPWTGPVSLADRPTTFGCGDRLGCATPGHLRAVRRFKVAPVLAQQSIRELTLTGRTFRNVLDDVTFLVFQSGYRDGYGADADHLKSLDHIRSALATGMTMITLDLSEVMRPEVARLPAAEVGRLFDALPGEVRRRVERDYDGKTIALSARAGNAEIAFGAGEARLCAAMYTPALDFAAEVYGLLCAEKGTGNFDLEMSIDETTTPTLPGHHLFIIRELQARGVKVVSLAPRFIGEFQKGIDYIGDHEEFERQFREHAIIAQAHGDYKISVHSGSDKFAIFPIVGRITGGRFHEKTAGTSWLEAVRLVAARAPALYRKCHKVALDRLPDAQKLYHITPDLGKIPRLEMLRDEELKDLMELAPARQVLHVAYGFILENPALKFEFFQVLDQFEDEFYGMLDRHFTRHMELLQIPIRNS